MMTRTFPHKSATWALRLEDWSDGWGVCLSHGFAICDEMYRRGLDIPDAWGYRPGIFGPSDAAEEYPDMFYVEMTDEQLAYVGEVCHRMLNIYRKAGKDY